MLRSLLTMLALMTGFAAAHDGARARVAADYAHAIEAQAERTTHQHDAIADWRREAGTASPYAFRAPTAPVGQDVRLSEHPVRLRIDRAHE